MIKFHNKQQLMAEIINFSLCFQRPRVHAGVADVAAGYWIKNLRANLFSHKQEVEN